MRREKRSMIRKTVNFAPSTWEQLELFMARDNVRSISAFLHSVCDQYAEIRSAQETVNIAQQKITRRLGNH